jgi:hypothetical protein
MTVELDTASAAVPVTVRRRPASIRYPQYDLAESIAVAKVISKREAGMPRASTSLRGWSTRRRTVGHLRPGSRRREALD